MCEHGPLKIEDIKSSSIVSDVLIQNLIDEISLLQRDVIQEVTKADNKDLNQMRDRVITFKGAVAALYYLGLIDTKKHFHLMKITAKLLKKIHVRRMENGRK